MARTTSLSYLDVPTDAKTGLPAYNGPYKGDGQDLFDKAVTCDGNTITYNFNKPWPDFPLAVAALHMMDPYREDKDKGDKSNFQIFSNGPYKIEGAMWNKNKGATLVRNDELRPDDGRPGDIRKALPDEIDFQIGQTSETIYDRLIADSGDDAERRSPPSASRRRYFTQIEGAVEDRSVLRRVAVRRLPGAELPRRHGRPEGPRGARRSSTDAQRRGSTPAVARRPTRPPSPSSTRPWSATSRTRRSRARRTVTPTAAKKLLDEAGVKQPYPIKFTYPTSETADKHGCGAEGDAGTRPASTSTLDGLGDTYYDVIQKPDKDSDVIWGGWGADWPSAITVTPPLFDSRPNLTSNSTGQDYGGYQSDEFNGLVDEAARPRPTLDDQTDALQRGRHQVLGEDVAYIPLEIAQFYFLHGSKVTGYINTAAVQRLPGPRSDRRGAVTAV